eukprot:CAMPEP_0179269346 /NCGR_PEP_ID=MMETSP0797-20121207/30910_1 /TAXON_ID=47934 /ORGANISM="Dinophysis acuminata, Strain DAEP01" /LENGTH=353 /DNA_ID=CAMNT_0020977659 /DNA_START=32 /DNA_END=1089 /DNA_ORIENTATION=+
MGQLTNEPAGALDVGATSSDLLAAVAALAECSSQLEHEPLKGVIGRATVSLLTGIEGRCQESVEFLLRGLAASGEGSDVQFDKLWTLHVMGKRSQATRQWILNSGGLAAIPAAMAMHPDHEDLLNEGAWLMYSLRGLDGIAALLRHSCVPVQAAAAWAVFDLARSYHGSVEEEGAEDDDWPEASSLAVLLAEVLRGAPTSPAGIQLQRACCGALRWLVMGHPNRGRLFLHHGGDELALSTLRTAHTAAELGEDLFVAVAKLIAALVDGNEQAGQRLRQLKVLEALVTYGLKLPGDKCEDAMWAIGQLGGVGVVMEAMHWKSDCPSALRGGVAVLSKITWNPSEEMLAHYPQAA